MRSTRREKPSGFFRGSEFPRLVGMIGMLFVLAMMIGQAADPRMWRWLTDEKEESEFGTVAAAKERRQAVSDPLWAKITGAKKPPLESVSTPVVPAAGKPAQKPFQANTEEDPEQLKGFLERAQAIEDKSLQINSVEMLAYWQLFSWAKHQTWEEMAKKGKDGVFGDLMSNPDRERGKLLRLKLNVRRIVAVNVDAKSNPLHTNTLYEVWGFSKHSQGSIFCCLAAELPEGMPVGPRVDEEAEFVGYFFKLQGYLSADEKVTAAPALIGRVNWKKPVDPPSQAIDDRCGQPRDEPDDEPTEPLFGTPVSLIEQPETSTDEPKQPVESPAKAQKAPPKKHTEEDPAEWKEFVERAKLIDDGEPKSAPVEMPAYWQLFYWTSHQTFEEMSKKGKSAAFDDFVNRPGDLRGKLVRLKLNIRLVKAHNVDPHTNRLELEKVYELWGVEDDAKPLPYFIHAADLPEGMPTVPGLREDVEFVGYFYKLQGYQETDAKPGAKPRVGPFLIGRLKWINKQLPVGPPPKPTEGQPNQPIVQSEGPASRPQEKPFKEMTEEDPEQLKGFLERSLAIVDGTLKNNSTEILAYWQLFEWAKNQTYEELRNKASGNFIFDHFMNRPGDMRGKLVRLKLNVRMVRVHDVDPESNAPKLGKIYELWGFSTESGSWLYCVLTAELPDGMPVGPRIMEEVEFAGYFYKLQGYLEAGAKPHAAPLQAPALIGKAIWNKSALRLAREENSDSNWWIWAVGVTIVVLGIVRVMAPSVFGSIYGSQPTVARPEVKDVKFDRGWDEDEERAEWEVPNESWRGDSAPSPDDWKKGGSKDDESTGP